MQKTSCGTHTDLFYGFSNAVEKASPRGKKRREHCAQRKRREKEKEGGSLNPRAGEEQGGLAPFCRAVAGESRVGELRWRSKGFSLYPEVPASRPSPHRSSALCGLPYWGCSRCCLYLSLPGTDKAQVRGRRGSVRPEGRGCAGERGKRT